jgi:anti-anti-sigma factor
VERGRAILADAKRSGELALVFGPDASAERDDLAPAAAMALDPYTLLPPSARFDAGAMLALLRDRAARARADGYEGLRVVADMDWLMPFEPTTDDIVRFELVLDRLASEVGATIVCAYRASSFDVEAIAGALSVHPVRWGEQATPRFELVSAGPARWRLSGEVDVAVHSTFATALSSALQLGDCLVDVTGLEFIDVAGMRAVAQAAREASVSVQLRGASTAMRRHWRLGGLEAAAPQVQLVA